MAYVQELQSTCCQLSNERNSQENYRTLRALLLNNVWKFFDVREGNNSYFNVPNLVLEDDTMAQLSALLICSSISGCTAMMDFILNVGREELFPDIPLTNIINSRLPCDFSIPDTWIHVGKCFATTPLHFACWRLDFVMIQKLLSLGANPNSLAWEEAQTSRLEGKRKCKSVMTGKEYKALLSSSDEEECTCKESYIIAWGNLKFDTAFGLSPLHFLALGLRSPPRHSLSEGHRHGLIHNVFDNFEMASLKLKNGPDSHLFQSAREFYPKHVLEPSSIKNEAIEACIRLLLSAGANPNTGNCSFMDFYYPLDVMIQPPLKLFYSSAMGRAGSNSESLRRKDFEHNIHSVTTAVRALLHAGFRLSPRFLSLHRWRPKFFDCFHTIRPRTMHTFIELLLYCGPFPAFEVTHNPVHDRETDRFGVLSNYVNFTCNREDMLKFIKDANSVAVPQSLLLFVLRWCSIPVLHLIIQTGREMLATGISASHTYVNWLIKMAICMQLSPLKHLCKLAILRAIKYNIRKIELLPLPPSLLRDLRVVRYKTDQVLEL